MRRGLKINLPQPIISKIREQMWKLNNAPQANTMSWTPESILVCNTSLTLKTLRCLSKYEDFLKAVLSGYIHKKILHIIEKPENDLNNPGDSEVLEGRDWVILMPAFPTSSLHCKYAEHSSVCGSDQREHAMEWLNLQNNCYLWLCSTYKKYLIS